MTLAHWEVKFRRLWFGVACWFASSVGLSASLPHYVFAHYMVCYSLYGQNLSGYEHEIQDAQAAGIDGFALDVGAWNGPDWYYKTNVALLYAAAEQLNTGFKLFFSVDMNNTNDIVQMIGTYANRTNSFRYHGGLVVSTFGGNGYYWTNCVFAPLTAYGVSNVFFVPDFQPQGYSLQNEVAGAESVVSLYPFVNGLFDFACGLPTNINLINAGYHQACTNAGKLFMAGVSPAYWGCAQTNTGRSYFESQGAEGTISQWNWIIQNQPDWVEIVTWNDLNESTYINPLATPDQYFPSPPRRYSHCGYLELSQRYIAWYKTGQQPAITNDVLFYFYRTHSTNAVAANTNDIPVSVFWGNVEDSIYTTVFLTAPATLQISSGNRSTNYSLPAGINSVRTPFAPGSQKFALLRSGTSVLSAQGPDILSRITNYDYFTASGYAYPVLPAVNLKVSH